MMPFQLSELRTGMLRSLLSVCLSAGVIAPAVGAQTRFEPPDTTADIARYKTVEECLVASRRITRAAIRALPFWPDTTEILQREELDSVPAPSIAAARLCSAKFNPDSVSLASYKEWITVYLTAGRDDAVDVIVRRRLATTQWNSSDSTQKRETIVGELLNLYAQARPMRWDKIRIFAAMLDEPGVPQKYDFLLSTYGRLFWNADIVKDTAFRRIMAEKIVAVAGRLTTEEKASPNYQKAGRYIVTSAYDFFSQTSLLNSLRRSSAEYVALKRANWEKARGDNNDRMPQYVGEKAPALRGDFWFSPTGDNTTASLSGPNADQGGTPLQRPTQGKVSIVIFLYGGCRDEAPIMGGGFVRPTFNMDCKDTYAVMHRLAKRFPQIEMTIVTRTTGYVGSTRPLTPQEEAHTLQTWWLGYHRLPAALAVTKTSFFRLEGPDRRRIDSSVENTVNYLFGNERSDEVGPKYAYLIDSDGTILHSAQLGRGGEQEFREILEIVTTRGK